LRLPDIEMLRLANSRRNFLPIRLLNHEGNHEETSVGCSRSWGFDVCRDDAF
jgi:hypothetical protein